MSADAKYTLDHALEYLHVGRNQGIAEGINEGRAMGQTEGYEAGRQDGWSAAAAEGNRLLTEQAEHMRQHLADKLVLQEELERQRLLIEQLDAKLRQSEQQNADLRGQNQQLKQHNDELRQLVDALKGANGRLQSQVGALDQKYTERSAQLRDQLWQYNRTVVFMNAVRGVLEDLSSDRSPNSDHVRQLFAEKYARQVSKSLQEGAIVMAPESDAEFAKALPRTREFILSMLQSVGKTHDHAHDSADQEQSEQVSP